MSTTNRDRHAVAVREAKRLAVDMPDGKLSLSPDGLLKNEAGQFIGPHRVCIHSSKDRDYALISTGDARSEDSHRHGKLVLGALRLVAKLAAEAENEAPALPSMAEIAADLEAIGELKSTPPVDAPSVDEVLSRLRIDLADTTSRKELLELDGAKVRAFLSAIGPEGLARGMANLNTEGK